MRTLIESKGINLPPIKLLQVFIKKNESCRQPPIPTKQEFFHSHVVRPILSNPTFRNEDYITDFSKLFFLAI